MSSFFPFNSLRKKYISPINESKCLCKYVVVSGFEVLFGIWYTIINNGMKFRQYKLFELMQCYFVIFFIDVIFSAVYTV